MPILYEATSPRGDHGIWTLTYGQPSKTPFKFNWRGKTAGGEYINFNIDTTCYVEVEIKEYLEDETSIISKTIQMEENNSILLELTQSDSLLLKAEKNYHMTVTLYDSSDVLVRILLRDLPIKILGSGV
ncbi:MAG: hypothetical protein RR342_01035 [Bacilli bacterium]|jgi:hypothetical protein